MGLLTGADAGPSVPQELTLVGLPAVVAPGGQGRLDSVALVNVCWRLLRSSRDGLSERQELQLRLNRADTDRQQLESSLARCRDQCSALESRCAQQQEQQRQLSAQIGTGQTRLTEAKDEVRRLQSLLQQRTTHYQHELKKQERQAERLKDMTHRLLDRERRGGGQERSGLVISGLLSRTDGTRARWRTPAAADRAREEAYERVLAGCEARHLRMVKETQRLRSLLGSVLRALVAASQQVACEDGCTLCGDPHVLNALELGLPYDPLSETVDSLVSCQLSKLTRLSEAPESSGVTVGADSPRRDAQELRQRLEQAERMVQEQRLLIETSTGGDTCDDSFQRNAFFVEERDELAMREQMLSDQRQALARERDMYTEAVLRLGRERMAFEAERAELKKRQFLASSPLLSRRPASARASPLPATKVEPPSPTRRPSSGRDHLLLTAPALRASAEQLLSPGDVTRPCLTSPVGRGAGGQRRSPSTSQRSTPVQRSPASSEPRLSGPRLSELGLPSSLYKPEPGATAAEPTDRMVDDDHCEP
ncbi:Afadin- and alpha-actinin-binding protein A [Amphibalanus amphitrite]|uniref:Afadin-and alpha-actinin-binding protein A n=1 Tax=Amphibalanus amphitrite TaxID=1232801 RepID=A0A6A4VQU3_AMPAM|nr:Afadin- and alpha-actinin-binding protein A [Amphibalanus amphitrite]